MASKGPTSAAADSEKAGKTLKEIADEVLAGHVVVAKAVRQAPLRPHPSPPINTSLHLHPKPPDEPRWPDDRAG
jgi:hypothetical protein